MILSSNMVLRRMLRSALVRGSATVFIGTMSLNVGNFVYHLLMGRMLGPQGYGDLGALSSLLLLFGAPLGILQLFVVKQTSTYWGKKSYGKIAALWRLLFVRLFIISILMTGGILAAQGLLGSLLQIRSPIAFAVFSAYFLLSGPATLSRSILQGTLSFTYMTVNNVAEVLVKIGISVLLVLMNFQLLGALLGPLAGGIVSFVMSVSELNILFRTHAKQHPDREKKSTSASISTQKITQFLPVFLASVSLTIFFSADVIWVRHFFPAAVAGEYMALSTIGKIVFYGVGPVLTVMFPLVTSKANSGQPYLPALGATLLVSLGLSVGILSIYMLFPKLIVQIVFGTAYFSITAYLGMFAVYMSIYSVNAILTYFLLSVSYYQPMKFLFLIALSQSIGIAAFHSDLWHVIWVNIITSLIYCAVCGVYIWQREKKNISTLLYNRE